MLASRFWWLGVVAACGRFHFDPLAGDGAGDDAIDTRGGWLRTFLASGFSAAHVGGDPQGGAVVGLAYTGTLEVDQAPIVAPNTYTNAAVIRLPPDGTTRWVVPLPAG